jgi:thiosulfate/3-mercaptopyruvate sulfurtransferase
MEWVTERLNRPEFTLVDPRRPMKYLSGHLPGAINIPTYKVFGPDGSLLPPESLARFIGASGFGNEDGAIIYDSPEGQNAAMLAWMLEYLGHADIYVMDAFFEAWKSAGHEVLYKPWRLPERKFIVRPNPIIRAVIDDLRDARGITLIDFRSAEEYTGATAIGGDQPGHIPGAVNVVWRDLCATPQRLLKPPEQIARLLEAAGVKVGARLVAYCRSGPRAALGYLALRQLDADVRLFDGSFAQWSRKGQPVEK